MSTVFKKITEKVLGKGKPPQSASEGSLEGNLNAVIASKEFIADEVIEITLRSQDDEPLPSFSAGAHIDFSIRSDLLRQYSLAGNPNDSSQYQIAVLIEEEGTGGSLALRDELKVGDSIQISLPRNHFPLVAGASYSVLFAGGIGITPLLSMAYQLRESGQEFKLYYRAKRRASAAYADLLKSEFGDAVECLFSDEGGREAFDLGAILSDLPKETELYTCGSKSFMGFITEKAANYLPENKIHLEHFYPDEAVDTSGDKGFELYCAKSDVQVQVPADKSIIEVLDEAGVDIPVSCTEGVCGSCITRFTEGEVEHRDCILNKAEKEKKQLFTPCCSRAKSNRLVIDA